MGVAIGQNSGTLEMGVVEESSISHTQTRLAKQLNDRSVLSRSLEQRV